MRKEMKEHKNEVFYLMLQIVFYNSILVVVFVSKKEGGADVCKITTSSTKRRNVGVIKYIYLIIVATTSNRTYIYI